VRSSIGSHATILRHSLGPENDSDFISPRTTSVSALMATLDKEQKEEISKVEALKSHRTEIKVGDNSSSRVNKS